MPLPFQLRTLRIGMQTTLVAPLAAAAAVVLATRSGVRTGELGAIFVAVAAAGLLATLLPWDRLFRAGWGMRVLYAWAAVNILLITFGVWATGGARSNLLFLYALTTVFFSIAFPPAAQVTFLVFTLAASAIALGLSTWDPLPLAVLLVLAFLANFLSRELKQQMAAHAEARRESERRWALVAVVSAAARNMSTMEPREVLQAVVDSIVALGFEAARIHVRQEGKRERVVVPRGRADRGSVSLERLPEDVIASAFERGRTVVRDRSSSDDETVRALDAAGVTSVVATPILVGGKAEAVLLVGSTHRGRVSRHDLEVFRMLAAQASLALENARGFEEQRRAMERMAELDRLKSDFLSTVSHELRTPLTVIRGMGRTLEERWSKIKKDERLDLLVRLNANAATLEGIIGEVLDFSRLEAGQLQVHRQPIDLEEVLLYAADRLRSLFREHELDVEAEPGVVVMADRALMDRVVENLLSNAAKYTPPGSRVVLSVREEGGRAHVAVADDGPGIAPEDVPRLGQRFFRGGDPNTRTTRGTGLGLALVSEILKLHGTRLRVESEVGRGSRFSFALPVARAEETTAAPALPPVETPEGVGAADEDSQREDERFETMLTAAQIGVEWAIDELYRRHNPRILRFLRARGAADARSVAFTVWMDVAGALRGFEGDEVAFRRWLFRLARGRLSEAERVEVSLDDGELVPLLGELVDPWEDAPTEEVLLRVGDLPPEEAEVVLLRTLGEFSADDVAEVVGASPAAVRDLETRGLQRLRDRTLPAEPEPVATEEGT